MEEILYGKYEIMTWTTVKNADMWLFIKLPENKSPLWIKVF